MAKIPDWNAPVETTPEQDHWSAANAPAHLKALYAERARMDPETRKLDLEARKAEAEAKKVSVLLTGMAITWLSLGGLNALNNNAQTADQSGNPTDDQ